MVPQVVNDGSAVGVGDEEGVSMDAADSEGVGEGSEGVAVGDGESVAVALGSGEPEGFTTGSVIVGSRLCGRVGQTSGPGESG